MSRSDIHLVAEELAAYAARRLAGFEQHRVGGSSLQPETRREWIRDILNGMAEVCGQDAAPLLQSFDQRMEDARAASAVEALSSSGQKHVVRSLRRYVSALGRTEGDQRARLSAVKNLLEDVSACLPWDVGSTGVYPARDEVEQALLRAVAQRPIRFTRVLLGGDLDPGGIEFLPGMVNDVETVRRTREFERLTVEYQDREEWPALCIVCMGGGRQLAAGAIDADELDMAVIREAGEAFTKRPEVRPVWTHQLSVPVQEQIRVLRFEPGNAPEDAAHDARQFAQPISEPCPEGLRETTFYIM